jgi:histidine triad (HIT) family protein
MNDAVVANCTFCRIVQGHLEAFLVYQDDVSLAFLDSRPLFPGHCLLIPRQHFPTLADLPSTLLGRFFETAQLLSQAIEQGLQAEGTFVAINNRVSQSVLHLHVHVVPRRKKDGLKGFFWPRQAYRDSSHRDQIQQTLQDAMFHLTTRKKSKPS